MNLDRADWELFYKLHSGLMSFVNRRLKLDESSTIGLYSPDKRLELRNTLLEHIDLIDAFAAENPFQFSGEELGIVRSWNDLVAGEFYVLRYLKKHTIFLTAKEPAVAYGVLALKDSFEGLLGPRLPYFCKTALLPFRGRIVYDGLLSGYNLVIGPGVRRSLNESYNEAKERLGVVVSLPAPAGKPSPAEPKIGAGKKAMGAGSPGTRSLAPAAARQAHEQIVALIDAFCSEHLDDEYRDLCRKLAGVLARKRPSPLTRGKPQSWASGIVRTVGWLNFLGDPSQPHHMKMSDIDRAFGVSEATGSAKATKIRKLTKLVPFDPEWTLPGRMGDNPLIWMLEVNGILMDIRRCPREAQVIAFEKGLIPYVPADRAQGDPGE